jgi:hypothetical protein
MRPDGRCGVAVGGDVLLGAVYLSLICQRLSTLESLQGGSGKHGARSRSSSMPA